MQAAMIGSHSGKFSILFLPMIDLSASDDSCIESTLSYMSSQARKQGCTPVITFDHPLWWKAAMIVLAADQVSNIKKSFSRLGDLI